MAPKKTPTVPGIAELTDAPGSAPAPTSDAKVVAGAIVEQDGDYYLVVERTADVQSVINHRGDVVVTLDEAGVPVECGATLRAVPLGATVLIAEHTVTVLAVI